MSLKSEMRSLVQEFDTIDDASFDLWSWLPSQEEAKKEMAARKENTDYVHELQPHASELMHEACSVIAYLLGKGGDDLTDEQKVIVDSMRN